MPRQWLFAPVLAVIVWATAPVQACPFCSAVSQTFAEEIESMDVAVFAKLVEVPPAEEREHPTGQELPRCKFQVTAVIKGAEWAPVNSEVTTLFFGEADLEASYLMMGTDPPDLLWGSPLVMTDRARAYIDRVVQLPREDSRMNFFLKYLEDEDEMLARDAYDEFARASYETVKGLREQMDRQQLLDWIRDTDVPIGRRKLYMTMLGVCGTAQDAEALRSMIQSSERAQKGGLDALVAAYLMLEGEAGLELIDQELLANDESEYADTYAAIMALRFHGNEADRIPRARLLQSMHHILDRTDLADLVIPDLARWEDWSAAPKLMELFKNADQEAAWVRVPVVNYLKASPLPDKDQMIAALEKIDPDAVKRANAFFAFSGLASQGAQRGSAADAEMADAEMADAEMADAEMADAEMADAEMADAEMADAEMADAEMADAEPVDAEIADARTAIDERDQSADPGFEMVSSDGGVQRSVTYPTAVSVGGSRGGFLTGGVLIGIAVLILVVLLISVMVLRGQRT